MTDPDNDIEAMTTKEVEAELRMRDIDPSDTIRTARDLAKRQEKLEHLTRPIIWGYYAVGIVVVVVLMLWLLDKIFADPNELRPANTIEVPLPSKPTSM